MISVTLDLRSCDKLTKLFYTLSANAANKDRVNFLRNEDAESFADAFNLSLDYAKHGQKIELPFHLLKTYQRNYTNVWHGRIDDSRDLLIRSLSLS